jgi:predicted RNA-binding Zn-ribbon protein involved in translation (DUF1610 family)
MKESQEHADCLICGWAIEPGQNVVVCPEPACGLPYHHECWEYLGGCARYGCPRMVEIKKAEIPASFWGSSQKQCPLCAETIAVAALTCPFCNAQFQDIKPVSRDELIRKPEDPRLKEYRKTAIWMLVFGLLGITSPLVLLIGGNWFHSHHAEIARASSTTRALAILALMVSAFYIVLAGGGLLIYSLVKS